MDVSRELLLPWLGTRRLRSESLGRVDLAVLEARVAQRPAFLQWTGINYRYIKEDSINLGRITFPSFAISSRCRVRVPWVLQVSGG